MNFNVFGIGVDIVENKRIEKIIKSNISARFLRRMFSTEEINLAESRFSNLKDFTPNIINFFAKRFAGKEAFVKALGQKNLFSFNEISILNDDFGSPFLKINNELTKLNIKNFLEKKNLGSIIIDI
jgi:holo-[acyl-carrier protein] synthase